MRLPHMYKHMKKKRSKKRQAQRTSFTFLSFHLPALFSSREPLFRRKIHQKVDLSTRRKLDHVLEIFGIHTVYVFHMPYLHTAINTYWEYKQNKFISFPLQWFVWSTKKSTFWSVCKFFVPAASHTASCATRVHRQNNSRARKAKRTWKKVRCACCKTNFLTTEANSIRHVEHNELQCNFSMIHLLTILHTS